MRVKMVRLTVAAAIWAGSVAASEPNTTEMRVSRALSRLHPPFQVQGRNDPPMALSAQMDAAKVPGVSIVFIDEGRIAWTGTFGIADVNTGRAVTPTTRFQAASISKAVAASAALALAESGRLKLDRPLNEQLKGWQLPEMPSQETPVTPRHLLSHTAGLTVHGFPGYAIGAPLPTTLQILEGTPPANSGPVKVESNPGTKWRYSGGGFTILQMLMSDVGGEPFPALMKKLVFRPVGMKHSGFDQPLSKGPPIAFGHKANGSAIDGGHVVHPELAAAGLWTTPSDLARWAIGVSNSFMGEEATPLSSGLAKQMIVRGEGNWGLGVRVDGESEWLSFSHGGSNQGFRALMQVFPRKGQGIVIMTNGDNGQTVIDAVRLAIGKEFGWPNSEAIVIPSAIVPRTELEQAVGTYSGNGLQVNVMLKEERLIGQLHDGVPMEFVPQGQDRYVALQERFKVEFVRDATGAVTALRAANMTLARIP